MKRVAAFVIPPTVPGPTFCVLARPRIRRAFRPGSKIIRRAPPAKRIRSRNAPITAVGDDELADIHDIPVFMISASA